jgi:mannose-6-phosphate isomerase-like protein (cupin superfamily)
MTELGSVEHRPGDFSRIPRGVAHDNFGRQESHLLFYIPAPAEELADPVRTSEAKFPPFPGWEPKTVNEVITDSLGGPGSMPAAFPADERLLLEQAASETDRIRVLRADRHAPGTTWLYRSAQVMIGRTLVPASDGRDYRRHLDADEVQYQISGRRALVTQRGVLHLEPGDFARIPTGVAFTSIGPEQCSYLTLVSTAAIPQAAATSKKAERLTAAQLDDLRHG